MKNHSNTIYDVQIILLAMFVRNLMIVNVMMLEIYYLKVFSMIKLCFEYRV